MTRLPEAIEQKFRIGQQVRAAERSVEGREGMADWQAVPLWIFGAWFDFDTNRVRYEVAERWPATLGEIHKAWAEEDLRP